MKGFFGAVLMGASVPVIKYANHDWIMILGSLVLMWGVTLIAEEEASKATDKLRYEK
ncbi:MAG: hypothetical protein JWM20_762 [Patescibacteria group bacterium]|nr:hypothetical protein [Patescibacteria group bacterium]